jgi:O-antigen ligase
MFVFPFCIFTLLGKGKWYVTVFTGAVSVGLLYMLALTKVRGAWAAFFFSFALLTLVKLKKLGIILLIIFIFSAVFINRSLRSDIFSMASMSDRSVMWQNSVEIFKKHPLLGSGLNTFYVNYMNIRQDCFKYIHGSYAHNCYLQMAADIGLVGLLMFILFAGSVVLKAFRSIKAMTDPYYYSLILGINMGLIAFLLHSFVDTNLYSLNLSALFWLSAGVMLAVVKMNESIA